MENYISLLFIIFGLISASVVAILAKKKGEWLSISAIAGLTLLSNILASANILKFPFGVTAPAGLLAYSLAFFLMDITNEISGPGIAKRGIYSGLTITCLGVILIWLMLIWPPAPFIKEERIKSANEILGLTPRLFGAGLLSYFAGSFINIIIYNKIKQATKGTKLWLRNNASTITGIFTSNLIFIPLGYYGTSFPVGKMIIGHTIAQITIALIDTIFIYAVVKVYRKGKITLTWEVFINYIKNQKYPDSIDTIIAIGSGGVPIAGVISSHLKKPLYTLEIKFRDEKNIPVYESPVIGDKNENIINQIKNKNILLVDDVSRTGSTLKIAKDYLGTYAKSITTFVFSGKADISIFGDKDFCINFPWKNI